MVDNNIGHLVKRVDDLWVSFQLRSRVHSIEIELKSVGDVFVLSVSASIYALSGITAGCSEDETNAFAQCRLHTSSKDGWRSKIRGKCKVANTSTPLTEMDFHGIIDKADRIFSILSASRLSSQYSSTTLSTTFTFSSSGRKGEKKNFINNHKILIDWRLAIGDNQSIKPPNI
uniref:Uncharacterized protein n=1 Tax=Rhizophagus irregularis (strain DAOM 181602 / DAOM 197198 / MUCL 43194) TaxID=747089 RepID=U9UNM3_RHIID